MPFTFLLMQSFNTSNTTFAGTAIIAKSIFSLTSFIFLKVLVPKTSSLNGLM
jgi:hypothetical protein